MGNCCARLSLAQLDTEARHCEMFSNLAHFPCLPGMDINEQEGKTEKGQRTQWKTNEELWLLKNHEDSK